MNLFQFFKRHFSTSITGLISYHNGRYPDSLILRTASATPSINSKSSIFLRKPTYLFIVPSRSRNTAFCLFFKFLSDTLPASKITTHRMIPIWSPHIFYIFRTIIAKHFPSSSKWFQQLSIKINFYRFAI